MLILVLPLLFVDFNPDFSQTPRFIKELYNLAHVPLFLLVSFLTWRWLHKPVFNMETGISLRFLTWLSLVISAAILIEFLQSLTSHRFASLLDFRRDLLGFALFIIHFIRPIPINLIWQRLAKGFTATWLIIELVPLTVFLVDYSAIVFQPNLLSDFESVGQTSRWNRGETIKPNTAAKNPDHLSVLKVELGTQRYEGTSLEHFPRGWSHATNFHVEVYSADTRPQKLHFKIDDLAAIKLGNQYSMRFNSNRLIRPGWNTINIPIALIRNGPADRKIDLSQIFSVTLFFVDRQQPGYMLIDNLRLE